MIIASGRGRPQIDEIRGLEFHRAHERPPRHQQDCEVLRRTSEAIRKRNIEEIP
jgi:hypothetical protein